MDRGSQSYARFIAGDESGLVELIRSYRDGLILYLNCFVQNIHTAEDLAEDVFVKLVVKKPRFNGKSSFKTWLYAIGRNAALDYLRKSRKTGSVSVDCVPEFSADERQLEDICIVEEQKIALHRALKKLNPDYQQVLYLCYFESFSNSQIAAVMKKSNRQVENLLYRGKAALKTLLEKENFSYEDL